VVIFVMPVPMPVPVLLLPSPKYGSEHRLNNVTLDLCLSCHSNETFAKLNIGQINTQGQVIISYYKNTTTSFGGLPAIKIINYFFGDSIRKDMQFWTFVPRKNVLLQLIHITQSYKYYLYLPIIERMIGSRNIEIACSEECSS
jgi:hypothetical protein